MKTDIDRKLNFKSYLLNISPLQDQLNIEGCMLDTNSINTNQIFIIHYSFFGRP